MFITIINLMRNLNIHGMIITILDQQFNEVSVPIISYHLAQFTRRIIARERRCISGCIRSPRPLRSVFFGSLLQAFRLWSVARIQGVGGENREREREI